MSDGPPTFDEMNLASSRLRAAVVAASDELFAEKENLLKPEDAVFLPEEYTSRGKWMDGWESRRKRVPGHDWAVVRLGVPGVLSGIVVDTAFFRGNFPAFCSLEGSTLPSDAHPDELLSAEGEWTEIVAKVPLKGDCKNVFPVHSPVAFSHVRLNIFPDGGVARLRVHGRAVPDFQRIGHLAGEVDLAAAELGADVVLCSDMFFGERRNLIMPDVARNMGDGWETRRRRGPGFDWAIVRLAARGTLRRAVIDTHHFKGNYPDACSLEVCDSPGASLETLGRPDHPWRPLLARSRLQADARHWFDLEGQGPVTHARLSAYPDGGVSRLRLFGHVTGDDRKELGLRRINTRSVKAAEDAFFACSGSVRWAVEMTRRRPFPSMESLERAAHEVWATTTDTDWKEASLTHPRIGETPSEGKTAAWSRQEQGSAAAEGDVKGKLAQANRAYEERFGVRYIVCATGKTAPELLSIAEKRLKNDPASEMRVLGDELCKITLLRIAKLTEP